MLIAICSVASAQPYAKASLIVRPVDYQGLVYSDPPRPNSTYVYFANEPIHFEILIVNNRGTEAVRLLTDRTLATSFEAKRPDGTDFGLRISDDVVRRYSTGDTPVDIGSEFTLSPRESLVLKTEVTESQLAQGEHIVLVSTSVKDADGRALAPQASRLLFEIRPSNAASAIEETRRNAMRAIRSREFTTAETWIENLLRLHPRSYAAYAMIGQISDMTGNRGRARAAYKQAASLLQSRTDDQYARREVNPRLTQDLIETFNQRMRANEDVPAK